MQMTIISQSTIPHQQVVVVRNSFERLEIDRLNSMPMSMKFAEMDHISMNSLSRLRARM